ncbi:methyl-accepting chemotaxis protein [Alteromonas sp. ASW11-36]|uniref:Methyl-accepting chemotaxis protein n=1 Tax=Alteromonas arenosi TaxID=3055817 RepID=A0ABT7SUW1_9ALTE|nr:methyl-accepting chemotaxis protein [Alteromonas sp. ASW11-36]MDM7859968.1 methyl-accepting chemotaxis protein [Alteromonas sp. ASW11-36]
MTLKSRLLLTVLSLVFGAILVSTILAYYIAVSNSTEALQKSAQEKLTVENTQTSEALKQYFQFIESQIRTKSFEPAIVDAAAAFVPAFNRYSSQRQPLSASERATLESYYSNDFANLYAERNNDMLSNPTGLVEGLSNNAKALQYDFIAGSRFAIGEKDGLVRLENDSNYASLHAQYHPAIRKFLQEFGYYDIFIADIDTGNIVYSVFKELDYATSVTTGPYAGTGISEAFQLAVNASNEDDVFFSELTTYLPSYDAMAGFISTPIYKDGRAIAILIFQIPLDTISNLLTHDQKWLEKGFGESGETYLVSPQGKLVTESRFFLETPEPYLEVISDKYPDVAQTIRTSGTSVGNQPVNTAASQAALRGESGFSAVLDYRDVEVFSSYSPVVIGGRTYALLAEIDVEEALRPAKALGDSLLISVTISAAILIGVASIIGLWIASRLVIPLVRLGDACEGLTTGEGDLTMRLSRSRIPEINRIVESFNTFIGQIRDIISQVKDDAETLAAASEQLSAITNQSEATSKQQRDQTHMVATAMQELSASIAEVSHSTVSTRDFSVRAKNSLGENMERADMAADNIKLLVELIRDSSEVITSLKAEVNQITAVLNVITSIADQTNLLALNAAIEAARAGEAGRGFSVVADEVRALATRSQENVVEISKTVEKMNISSDKSVHAMERAAAAADGGIHLVDLVTTAMNELSQTIDKVQDMANTVATATTEQDSTSDSVTQNVTQISDMAADVENGATQTSKSAKELASIAAHTNELVRRFKV